MPTVDIELQKVLLPLTQEEYAQLEENIVADGVVYEPIVLWNDTIVDGHNRWSIIQKHPEIKYRTINKDFDDKEDAIKWMCEKQLGRRNLTEIQRTILIGEIQQSRVRKLSDIASTRTRDSHGRFGQETQKCNSCASGNISNEIGKEFGISRRSVDYCASIAKGIRKAEEISPGIRGKISSRELTPTKSDITKLRSLEGAALINAVKDIEAGKRIIPEYKPSGCATQMVHTKEYDIHDFKEELRGKVVQLDNSFDLTCRLVHSEMLETQEGKDALSDALLEVIKIVQKYKELC